MEQWEQPWQSTRMRCSRRKIIVCGLEIARVFVCLDHLASVILNANHSAM
jgi:hypothetical protein